MFELEFNLKLIKIIIFLYFDVLLKKKEKKEIGGEKLLVHPTLWQVKRNCYKRSVRKFLPRAMSIHRLSKSRSIEYTCTFYENNIFSFQMIVLTTATY